MKKRLVKNDIMCGFIPIFYYFKVTEGNIMSFLGDLS